jgi:hypothetical protein
VSNVHTVVLDWDGTLVTQAWPGMGDWQPGAIEACQRLHAAGLRLVVCSARLSHYTPWGEMREPAIVEGEYQKVRAMLDAAGLTFVDIWRLHGKPGASRYVDDKAVFYAATARAWDRISERLILELTGEEPEFPAFIQEDAFGTA